MIKWLPMERIKADCRHMRWDRPCALHKAKGVHCATCPYYDQVRGRILIVKLDALGDVLRTTCILSGIKEKYPRARVTWITMPEAFPLLQNIPSIDRVVAYGPDALAVLTTERFDAVFGLDSSPKSAALASLAKAVERKGFGLDPSGRVFPYNAEANDWFLMGLFDDLKRKNKRTYQDILMEICGLKGLPQEIVVRLTDDEKAFARKFSEKHGLPMGSARTASGIRVIGINTGSGRRWAMKQWPIRQCVEFIRGLLKNRKYRVLLFGGEGEAERNKKIKDAVGEGIIDTGTHNTLREFMALVDLCDLLVVSDSLGLHVALGLGKKVVTLFGPSSAAEIDVYGRGVKIVPDVECTCCYLRECGRGPSCMESISPEMALKAVSELFGREE